MADEHSYLRFPSICGDLVSFAAEDDVWLADLNGGRAWRLTADQTPVGGTRLAPDGFAVAFSSERDGSPEIYVVDADGGPTRRLTHWGDRFTRLLGWTDDGRVLACSPVGEAFRDHPWAYAVPLDGGLPERLPYGPVTGVARGPAGVTVLGVNQNPRSAAAWKRYRGGMTGALWIDTDGTGGFTRFLTELGGQIDDPGWIGDRLVFLSDHEGWGNVYSCRADGTDLRRHTDHGDAYARAAHTDGTRLVYQCLGELWLLDDLAADSQPRRLDIGLAGPRTARLPRPLDATGLVGDVAPDHCGRASAVEVYGTIHWLTHRDGPARVLADEPGVRRRLPRVLGADAPARVAWITDADQEDALELAVVGTDDRRRVAGGQLGRVLELAASPDGAVVAVASHDGRLLLVDVHTGDVHTLVTSEHGEMSGLSFSPDSRWLAWSHPGPDPLRQIRLARIRAEAPAAADEDDQVEADPSSDTSDETTSDTPPAADDGADDGAGDDEDDTSTQPAGIVADPLMIDATTLRFTDTDPVFTVDGRYLAFLSARTFDPVYDAHVFDMSFPAAIRPYLLPLAARTPSPFDPEPDGRPVPQSDSTGGDSGSDGTPPPVVVDAEGLDQRAVPLPVPAGRYFALRSAKDGLLWSQTPLIGVLGTADADSDDDRRPRLLRYDLRKRRTTTLLDSIDSVTVTGDGRWMVVEDGVDLRLLPTDRRIDLPDDSGESSVDIDVSRLRVQLDPAAQWRQMYDEHGRLMRDHFWIEDFAGVDWAGVLARYRPVLDRIGSRDDLSELFWEIQGELGTSHAYETPPRRWTARRHRLGHLGADLARSENGEWRVDRVVPGESSAPEARSPLVAPGVAVRAGDVILAIDGRPVNPVAGPAPLLIGAAGVPVELTVRRDEEIRRVVVEPLADERPLRYHAWVADRRSAVHAASDGRVGYLHVPDMTAEGWAQLHRDLHLEVGREALVIDVRNNTGGHISQLVLEKLARSVTGWDMPRHQAIRSYPENAPRGPLVAVANECAGSDGDIIMAVFKQRALGPVVGTRTWGGVIGIDSRYRLVDGTLVTQPRYASWFDGFGWGIENHGVDPDVEVLCAPQDWADGADPQLDTAVRLALEALTTRPAATPPDLGDRPSRRPPVLPARGTR